jgi:hypothetical protein
MAGPAPRELVHGPVPKRPRIRASRRARTSSVITSGWLTCGGGGGSATGPAVAARYALRPGVITPAQPGGPKVGDFQ